jgi:hypothetical protein
MAFVVLLRLKRWMAEGKKLAFRVVVGVEVVVAENRKGKAEEGSA